MWCLLGSDRTLRGGSLRLTAPREAISAWRVMGRGFAWLDTGTFDSLLGGAVRPALRRAARQPWLGFVIES